jgi:hypothetical protein
MATYAIVIGGIVDNIILTDNKEESEIHLGCNLIESTDDNPAYIGGSYDQETGKFNQPEIIDQPLQEPIQ